MNRTDLDKKIKSICYDLRYQQGYINSISVLNRLDYLSNNNINEWKKGKIPYLEKACGVNLSTLSFINKTIKKYSNELKLKKSLTVYTKICKGNKTKLIFSKTADKNIEIAYSTHYVDIERIKELKNKDKKNNKTNIK